MPHPRNTSSVFDRGRSTLPHCHPSSVLVLTSSARGRFGTSGHLLRRVHVTRKVPVRSSQAPPVLWSRGRGPLPPPDGSQSGSGPQTGGGGGGEPRGPTVVSPGHRCRDPFSEGILSLPRLGPLAGEGRSRRRGCTALSWEGRLGGTAALPCTSPISFLWWGKGGLGGTDALPCASPSPWVQTSRWRVTRGLDSEGCRGVFSR